MTWDRGDYAICEVIIRRIPLGVVAIDDSTISLERSTNEEMIARPPDAVSPRESTVEETNGRDDVDWLSNVRQDLESDFNRFQHWFCSERVG